MSGQVLVARHSNREKFVVLVTLCWLDAVTHTCAALADHHAQVDGRPVGIGRTAVGTAAVARLRPDSLSHLAIGQGLPDGSAHGLHPLLLEQLRLHREAV